MLADLTTEEIDATLDRLEREADEAATELAEIKSQG